MKWVVFALGFILSLGGLVAISQGYDIVDIERGWTLVISGTTAFCAGIIAICLGFIVARIEALIAVAAQGNVPVEVDDRPATRFALAAVRPSFDEAAEAAVAAAMDPSLYSAQHEPVPAEVAMVASETFGTPEAEPPQEKANLSDFSFANLGILPRAGVEVMPLPINVVTAPLPDGPKIRKGQQRASPAAPLRIPVKTIPAPGPWPSEPPRLAMQIGEFAHKLQAEAGQITRGNELDWLEQELVRTGTYEELHFKPKPDEHAHPEELGQPEEEEQPEVPEHSPLPEEKQAVPVIIGRYESNGASYVLFNDGSIEAETDSGVYRFASIAELKKFIEARA